MAGVLDSAAAAPSVETGDMPEIVSSGTGMPPGFQEPSESEQPSAPDNLGESPDSTQKPSVTSDGNGEKGPEKPAKISRYERTKQHRAELIRREALIQQREAQFAQRERELQEAKKPKREYTLEDLKKYRQAWEDEGNFDLVEKADAEIKAMEEEEKASKKIVEVPQAGTPEHETEWHKAEAELYQADPQFMRPDTKLDKKLREIMGSEDGNVYRQHPRGIVAAYHRAKMELMEVENKDLQTENQKLKDELKRFHGLTSVGGGVPGRMGSGNRVESLADFKKLSSADMLKHLKADARSSSERTPWF